MGAEEGFRCAVWRGQPTSPEGGVTLNKYELALVLDPALTDEDKAEKLTKVSELIERFKGEIEKVDDWGKRRLAYEIDKKNEGFYHFVYFNAESEAPAEIENRLRIMDDVLRYLIVRKEA